MDRLARDGLPIGVLSTHFRRPHCPSEREFRLADLYLRQAADLIERQRANDELQRSEAALREADRRKDEFLAMRQKSAGPKARPSNRRTLL